MSRVYTDHRRGIRIEFDSELFVEKATLFNGHLDISETIRKIDQRIQRCREMPTCVFTEDMVYWHDLLQGWKSQAVVSL